MTESRTDLDRFANCFDSFFEQKWEYRTHDMIAD